MGAVSNAVGPRSKGTQSPWLWRGDKNVCREPRDGSHAVSQGFAQASLPHGSGRRRVLTGQPPECLERASRNHDARRQQERS